MLVDEIWHAAGDEGSDIDWYVKRTILGGIYSTTEVFMLTDSSPGLFHSLTTFKFCLKYFLILIFLIYILFQNHIGFLTITNSKRL